jgi:lysophospholipase L1-like esterase
MKISKIRNVVKDTWLTLGITILLLCLLEASLSLVFFVKDRFRASDPVPADPRVSADTYSNPTWVNDYYKELTSSFVAQWTPYVYWRRKPYHGEYINIDTNGMRLTTSFEQEPRPSLKIFMFGGSTLWGTGARDAFTIPSIFAKELQQRGLTTEVLNFGETGYVSTQGVITLLLQLQKGHRPDLVIFYDGVNDLYSAYQQHVAGLPQNEFNRVKEFNLSHPVKLKERTTMVFRDIMMSLSTARLAKRVLKKAGMWRKVVAEDSLPLNDLDARKQVLPEDVVATYKENIEVVKALSEHYHFKYLFYWQPTIFHKANLTEYEHGQREEMQSIDQFVHRTHEIIGQSRLAETQDFLFQDLSRLFADVRKPLYLDWCHLGESGNEMVAERMANDAVDLLITTKMKATADLGQKNHLDDTKREYN